MNVHQLKEKREYGLDNTLSDTFPCSDPLSSIPNPLRIRLDHLSGDLKVAASKGHVFVDDCSRSVVLDGSSSINLNEVDMTLLESAFYDGSPPGKREWHALDPVRQVNNSRKT